MELAGEISLLRPWRLEDAESLVRYANNIKIWRNVTDRFPFPYEYEHAKWFINKCLNEGEPPRTFAIVVEGKPVGCVSCQLQDDVYSRTGRIGYWVAEPFWGRGIATEALSLLTDYIFDRFDFNRLEASVYAYNPASARVLEKAGYTFEARHRARIFKDNQVTDELVYAKIR